jgi:ankyrin repeat protein
LKNEYGRTPLQLASSSSYIKVDKYLEQYRAKDNEGETQLQNDSKSGSMRVIISSIRKQFPLELEPTDSIQYVLERVCEREGLQMSYKLHNDL